MGKETKKYYYRELDSVWTSLIGPGLDFHDLERIDEKHLIVILEALERAFEAGRKYKAMEICKALDIKS